MKNILSWVGAFGAAGVMLFTACRVVIGEDVRYACVNDGECGAEFKCIKQYCCKPSGAEVCDGLDNDCDGVVDRNDPESCNDVDDDCDGVVDEGFDKQNDRQHCGACNRQCQPNELCSSGACKIGPESDCSDGADNNGDGKIDCEDAACAMRSCGTGCTCVALAKIETACNDTADNDGDGSRDCMDSDCVGKASSCGSGCTCLQGGGKKEGNCWDQLDNDADGKIDCLDSDCAAAFCTPAPLFYTCTMTMPSECKCNGMQQTAEVCGNGLDDDCNGKKDCEESACGCAADGGGSSDSGM